MLQEMMPPHEQLYRAASLWTASKPGFASLVRATCSACESKDDQERPVEIVARVQIEAAEDAPDTIATQRNDLVGRDLGTEAKTIARARLNDWPQTLRRPNLRRHRADDDRRGRVP